MTKLFAWFLQIMDKSKTTILLVDDEPELLEVVSFFLEAHGYNILKANSASSAMDMVRSQQGIDLLLTDFEMPEQTGLDLLKMVKKECPGLPVAFFTGYGAQLDRDAEEHGAIGVLSKPIDHEKLELLLKENKIMN